jgi:hypothetical protein
MVRRGAKSWQHSDAVSPLLLTRSGHFSVTAADALLRSNDRFCHFANMIDEKPNQRAQHPVLQRQDRDWVSANLQIDR